MRSRTACAVSCVGASFPGKSAPGRLAAPPSEKRPEPPADSLSGVLDSEFSLEQPSAPSNASKLQVRFMISLCWKRTKQVMLDVDRSHFPERRNVPTSLDSVRSLPRAA